MCSRTTGSDLIFGKIYDDLLLAGLQAGEKLFFDGLERLF